MTRHTPDFLRQRSSNMSLRMAASLSVAQESTVVVAPAPSTERPMNKATKAMIIGDISVQSNMKLCADCCSLATGQFASLSRRVESEQCAVCQIREGKPEAFTRPFCKFLEDNPTIFHAVDYFKSKAKKLGYTELPPRDDWSGKLEAGGKYFVTRNGSSIIAFTVGKAYKPGNGVAMIAGHIDALTAKLKPVSNKPNKQGYVQLGVAPYAGGLNETWWDRDLSIGGRVIVRDGSGKTSSQLVKLGWPIAKIPTLAPHFGVGMLGSNNKETEAVPVIGLDNSDAYPSSASTPAEPLGLVGSFTSTQPPKLVKLISSELGISDYSQIVNWELELFDSQPATVFGMDKEFITAGRIDDKLCSWAAFEGLLAAEQGEDEGTIKMVALFDDEEIGSLLRQGAKGNFLPLTIERAVEALCGKSTTFGPGVIGRTYASSFLVSADVTHAVNPNFVGRYLDGHAPRLNVGIVICADSNGHMTTDPVSTAILTRVCELTGCTPQVFMIRNDSRSGGTVGPTLSSMMGVKAADAGMPQLSMHSVRATTGALDPGLGVKFFKGFLDNWEKVDREWSH
ncbi:aminopeptidase I zinc metalloprotease [Pseudomassariella vexata]|uniref:Aminopeptidase I zinc metalloprotease n=1 Tax=Pseudomassariella vexata TaxID=1141098 RepID=A0A1Y2EJX1_9PEZI|nr:aminopeptidase I zinc metalloprotease [Pseudomassariella vexata]ORY71115.1 aminopeptidase I zinc metalloprotease [Pseudomassariella vexata]